MADVLIVGGGVGGLTLALCLHREGIPCVVLEAAPEFRALGVGINILPHAAAELARLGLEDELTRVAVLTDEASFFNRFGQLVHSEPLGRAAGYAHPQFSIHRADLHETLLRATRERLGEDRILLGRRLAAAEQDAAGVALRFEPDPSGAAPPRSAAPWPWAATASTRPSAGSSTLARASPNTPATTCGGAYRPGRPS